MAVFSNRITNRRRWFWRLMLLTIAIALVVGVLLWRALETVSIIDIQARVEELKPASTGIRWLLIGLAACFWPAITNGLYRRGQIDTTGRNRLLALRWRVLAWLVLLELMLGQNLLGHFFQAIQGGRV